MHDTAFSKEGMTSTGGCASVMAVWDCEYAYSDNFLALEFRGEARTVRGTVTWTAPGAAAPAMTAYLLSEVDGEWLFDARYATEYSSAGSLDFDWDLRGVEGRGLAIVVSAYQGVGYVVGYAGASASFPFTLEGTVTSTGN